MAQPSQNPDWAKQMLLNGGVNPLYGPQQPDPSAPAPPPDPQRGSIAASVAQAPQTPSQPTQPSPTPATPSSPSPQPQPDSQNAPIAGAPEPYHHGTLAKIMLGIGEAIGNPLATRIGQRDREREQEISEYNRPGNVAALQNRANLTQQQTQAEIAKEQAQTTEAGASTAKTQQETENLKMAPPGKEEFLQKFRGALESGEEDPQTVTNGFLALSHSVPGVQRQDLVDIANQTKAKAPVFKIGPQGIREPIRYGGRNWYGNEPDAPPEVQQAAKNAQNVETQVHQNKLQEQAASRSNITLASEQGAKTKDLETGKTEATKALGEIHDAQNQQQMIQDLLSGKMNPASQTAAMFKMIGLEQPTGTHRIMPAEIEGIEHLGGVSDRLKQKLLSWKEGDRFSPDLIPDVVATAKILTQNKIKTANDSLESTHQIRGYKAPGSDEKGRFDSQPAAGGGQGGSQQQAQPKLQVGQTVSVKGKQMKVTAVHPDGSFDAQ